MSSGSASGSWKGVVRAVVVDCDPGSLLLGRGLIASGWMPAVATGWLVRGVSLLWLVVAAVTATQRLTVDTLQSRVAGAVTLLLFAGQPVTQVVGAALVCTRPPYSH